MINVEKGNAHTEGTLAEIGTDLVGAIVGVFDAINNHFDESLASAIVNATIKTAAEKIEEDYGVNLSEEFSRDHVVDIQVIKVPKDGISVAGIIKEAEHYRKAKQGADSDAKPTE